MRYFLVDDDPDLRYDDEDELIEHCVSTEYFEDDDEGFDDWLNEEQGRIEVNGHSFYPSEILYSLDQEAYYEDKTNWAEDRAENEREEAYYNARHTRPGDSFYVCGSEVYVYEEDEEYAVDPADAKDTISAINKQIEEDQRRQNEDKEREDAFASLFQTL